MTVALLAFNGLAGLAVVTVLLVVMSRVSGLAPHVWTPIDNVQISSTMVGHGSITIARYLRAPAPETEPAGVVDAYLQRV